MSTLTARQQRAYKSLIDIWRPSQTVTSGAAGATTYTKLYASVPCLLQQTPNIDQPSDFGEFKEFTVLVLDTIYLAADIAIRDNDVVINKSLTADGSQSRLYNTGERVRGEPTYNESYGGRLANEQSVKCMSIDHLPTGITP
jgi:hypothetical protein